MGTQFLSLEIWGAFEAEVSKVSDHGTPFVKRAALSLDKAPYDRGSGGKAFNKLLNFSRLRTRASGPEIDGFRPGSSIVTHILRVHPPREQ